LSPAVKYVIAFAAIFVLLALFALVLRRLTGSRLSLPAPDRGRSRQPRLGIVDVYDLDRQRQLILLRRDNVEHLLLIGGPNDVIVETNIVRTPGARLPEPGLDRTEPMIDRALEAAARPLIEPVQRPEAVVARLGAAEARGDGPPRPEPGLPPEPILKPDVVALAPARAEPPRPAAPQPLREPPPPPRPAPQPRPHPAVKPPPPHAGSGAETPHPPVRAVPDQPRQAPAAGGKKDATIADAAVLSDMAKQLEEALKRPSPRPAAAGNGPAPFEERPPRAGGAPGREPVPTPPPRPAPEPAAARPKPAPVTRIRPAAEPEAALAPPSPPPEAGRAPGATEPVDPFSVEEIEAEFARLLGRPLDQNDRRH
jgi:hypothetical protein